MSDFSEKAYLEELIKEFFPSKRISVDEAWNEIQTRYRVLDGAKETLIETLSTTQVPFPELFFTLSTSIHGFMFEGVVSNAGQFRKETDTDGGMVLYGPVSLRTSWGSKFKGEPPLTIEPALKLAFQLFSIHDENPVRTSIIFYQKFVRIHPFYDANGRVARFIITLYLLFHGYYIEWKKLEGSKKNTFLSKLNACHLRENQISYDEYLNYLYSFWEKFVVKKDSLTSSQSY